MTTKAKKLTQTEKENRLYAASWALAKEAFGDRATALHALEVYDRLDESSDEEDIAAVYGDLKAVHEAASMLFPTTSDPSVSLTLFGMVIDGDLDEGEFVEELQAIQEQARTVFGEAVCLQPDVVLGMYERKFGTEFDVDDDENEDENEDENN